MWIFGKAHLDSLFRFSVLVYDDLWVSPCLNQGEESFLVAHQTGIIILNLMPSQVAVSH